MHAAVAKPLLEQQGINLSAAVCKAKQGVGVVTLSVLGVGMVGAQLVAHALYATAMGDNSMWAALCHFVVCMRSTLFACEFSSAVVCCAVLCCPICRCA